MCNLQFLVIFILTSVVISLFGQMTPNAPVKNFRLPRFGANGFTDWVLQGERGLYDGEEQVRVEGMSMRVYSGDERMALELSMDSPTTTLRLEENRAYSDDTIEIIAGGLPGGKGGFGSMLRALGNQIQKTTNKEACRDLSGRRLRDINEVIIVVLFF